MLGHIKYPAKGPVARRPHGRDRLTVFRPEVDQPEAPLPVLLYHLRQSEQPVNLFYRKQSEQRAPEVSVAGDLIPAGGWFRNPFYYFEAPIYESLLRSR